MKHVEQVQNPSDSACLSVHAGFDEGSCGLLTWDYVRRRDIPCLWQNGYWMFFLKGGVSLCGPWKVLVLCSGQMRTLIFK